jgi:hypothetical protein
MYVCVCVFVYLGVWTCVRVMFKPGRFARPLFVLWPGPAGTRSARQGYKNAATEIRKSVVFALVEIYLVLKDALKPYLACVC